MPHIPGHTGATSFQDWTPEWWGRMTLAEFEPAQYYSAGRGQQFGRQSPGRQRYFENAYQDILKDFYGASGQAVKQGREPMDFMDFLDTDPWTARYSRLPQTARGTTGMMSSPRTRFLYNY